MAIDDHRRRRARRLEPSHGMTGSSGAEQEAHERQRGRLPRRRQPSGSTPSSSRAWTASASSGRRITSAAARWAWSGVHAVGLVHRRQLVRLGRRVALQLAPLDLQLALDQLVLRRDADPLAGRHADRAGDRAGDARPAARSTASAPPPAKPRISDTLDTSPSLTPNTAARAARRRPSGARGAGRACATRSGYDRRRGRRGYVRRPAASVRSGTRGPDNGVGTGRS